jgi:hypothetical protein
MLILWEKTLIPYKKKTTKALLDASKEVGLEENPEKTKYRLVSEGRTEAENKDRE